jgi:cullin 3
MVLNKFGDHLYNSLVATITKHLQRITIKVEQTQGGPFLEELNKRWGDHNKSMQMIRGAPRDTRTRHLRWDSGRRV